MGRKKKTEREPMDEHNTTLIVKTFYFDKEVIENVIFNFCQGPYRLYANKAEFIRTAIITFIMEFHGSDEIMIYDVSEQGTLKNYSLAISPTCLKYIEYLVSKKQFGNASDAIRVITGWYYKRIMALQKAFIDNFDQFKIENDLPVLQAPYIQQIRNELKYKKQVAKYKKDTWGLKKIIIPQMIPEVQPNDQIFIPGRGMVTVRPTKIGVE
jgi:hypothetical protein